MDGQKDWKSVIREVNYTDMLKDWPNTRNVIWEESLILNWIEFIIYES